jgi:hypothetical protein
MSARTLFLIALGVLIIASPVLAVIFGVAPAGDHMVLFFCAAEIAGIATVALALTVVHRGDHRRRGD